MVGAYELGVYMHLSHQFIPYVSHASGVPVGDQFDREKTTADQCVKENGTTLTSSGVGGHWAEDDRLGEKVHNDHASVVGPAQRKAKDYVHSSSVERHARNLVGRHLAQAMLLKTLYPLAFWATTDVLTNYVGQTRPIEISFDKGPSGRMIRGLPLVQ